MVSLVPLTVLQPWKVTGSPQEPCSPFLLPLPHFIALVLTVVLPCFAPGSAAWPEHSLLKGEEPLWSVNHTFGILLKPGDALQCDWAFPTQRPSSTCPRLWGEPCSAAGHCHPMGWTVQPQCPAPILPGARCQQGTGPDYSLASAIRTSPSASRHTPAPAADTRCFLIWGLVCRH